MSEIPDKLRKLKTQLSSELNKENSDTSLVLHLSNEIAKFDELEVRFSVDAGIINRLGKELVGRHETAVSELVKNAYDADALEVNLIFENAWEAGGTLRIEDNGNGMTRDQLINGFMRLSSSDKIHNPISPKYKRTRAGKKGIGRFATQRLGKHLTIITQTKESTEAFKVIIDWTKFEVDKDLMSISNSIQTVPKIKEEGTDLRIEMLREGWSDAMIKRIYRYTSDLLQPFPLSKKRKEEEGIKVDPGFKSSYSRKDGTSPSQIIIDEEEAFYKHALAEIEGYVLDDGQGCWALKSERLNFPQEVFLIGKNREDDKSKFTFIKDVHFKCYYFIYDSALLPAQTLTFIKDVANEKGGIRLYRNGFRVLPYGEKGDDWIGLDLSTRRRVIIVPHQNLSFFGFAEVTDFTGDIFEETSSREGLIENKAFTELTDFIYRSIIGAVLKIAELRGRKGITSQRDWKKKNQDPTIDVDSAISEIEQIINGSEEKDDNENSNKSNYNSGKFKEAFDKLKDGREKEKEKARLLIEENNMLRVLAGIGLVIGEFIHEIKRFLPAFHTDITYLKGLLTEYKEALQRAERLDQNIKSFTAYTSYFDKTISQNILRELESIELRDVVNTFQDVIERDIQRSGYVFHKPIYDQFDLFTVPMHKSEWASILFNFYTNSKKAIKRADVKGEIFVRCGKNEKNAFLEFSDNGDGIPKENEDKIFNAFFTTTSPAGTNASDQDSTSGMGLGLKIVRDIVESYGGNISVAPPENGFRTTIRVEIPLNSQTEDNEQI